MKLIILQTVQQVNSFLSSFLNLVGEAGLEPATYVIFAVYRYYNIHIFLARLTGFEPATYGVEDHCSSNWASSALNLWLFVLDSNQRPPDYRSSALPTELTNNWKVGAGSENRTHLHWRGRPRYNHYTIPANYLVLKVRFKLSPLDLESNVLPSHIIYWSEW